MQAIRLLTLSLLALSCADVPPQVVRAPAVPLDEEPVVWLVAPRQAPRIEESLTGAGIVVTPDPSRAHYVLRVDVGAGKGSQSCGSRNNVRYVLLEHSAQVVQLKGRGWTGSCTPNIFDGMSRLLALHFPGLPGS